MQRRFMILKHRNCLSGLFLIACTSSHGLPNDAQEKIYIQAGYANFSQATHTGHYQKKVTFDQGSRHLRAESAESKHDQQNQLLSLLVQGNPAHFWVIPKLDQPALHAFANQIVYYPNKHLIELTGQARIVQGADEFKAPKIVYDIDQQHVVTKRIAKEKTVIIIDQKNQAHYENVIRPSS